MMGCVSNATWVWVLEAFATGTNEFRQRWTIPGFTDEAAAALLNTCDLGFADLYDVNDAALDELDLRLGLTLDREAAYYLIGREQV
jgi:hypothetical protein